MTLPSAADNAVASPQAEESAATSAAAGDAAMMVTDHDQGLLFASTDGIDDVCGEAEEAETAVITDDCEESTEALDACDPVVITSEAMSEFSLAPDISLAGSPTQGEEVTESLTISLDDQSPAPRPETIVVSQSDEQIIGRHV
jgi:hypothetical protein